MQLQRILLVTTVPETLATILKHQPRHFAHYFNIDLVTSPGDFIRQVRDNEGLVIHTIRMVRGIKLCKDVVSVMHMALLLHKIRPALVHSYTPKAGLVTMLAAWLCRVPVRVHTFTGLIFPTSHGFKQKLLIRIDRLICACATHIVPEGLGVKNDLERFHITRKPLHMIGHGNIAGVDTAYFSTTAFGIKAAADALRTGLAIGADEFVFCFVGRLNRDKGLTELMQAFSALPNVAHLLLVGGFDQSAPISAELRSAINAHPRVHLLGFLSDVRPAMQAANVLVLPSYREGFPNVVLQAGAMGLPVIATDINGCNEVIEPGFNGWLVPARSSDALQVAMQAAMDAPELMLTTMGQRSRERIKERFERAEHWQRMVEFYSDLLNKQRPSWPTANHKNVSGRVSNE